MTREVEWDDGEQALMLALAYYRAQCCPAGHYLPDSGGVANEDKFVATDERCHACTAVAQKAHSLMDAPSSSAIAYRVARKPG